MQQKPMNFRKEEPQQEQEIVHMSLGSTMKPAEFSIGQFVKPKNLPGTWVVLQILENSKYIIGSEGITKKVEAKDLTLTEGE